MGRHLIAPALASAFVIGGLAWPFAGGMALARQDGPDQTATQEPASAIEQEGGRIKDLHEPDPSMQHVHGQIIRPLVPEGGSGPQAVEEGTFSLAPGDILELECATPKDQSSHLTYKIEDDQVVKLLPMGVRTLVPMSMLGGQPKPITGLVRYVALFQAQGEGETTIRMTLGRKQYQYQIKVEKKESQSRGGR